MFVIYVCNLYITNIFLKQSFKNLKICTKEIHTYKDVDIPIKILYRLNNIQIFIKIHKTGRKKIIKFFRDASQFLNILQQKTVKIIKIF